jgi:4-amino-4-deoxy-L-arabinose transferase-like glycosyltransferase
MKDRLGSAAALSGQTTLEPDVASTRPSASGNGRRRAWLLVAAGVLSAGLVALAAYALVGHSEPRVSGITQVQPRRTTVVLQPGGEACQAARIPADTGAVQILSRAPAAAVSLAVEPLEAGGVAAVSRSARAQDLGVRLKLDRTIRREQLANVCVRGASAPMPLLGDDANPSMTVNGKQRRGGLALTFYRPGSETAAAMIGPVFERIGRTRGAFGGAWRGYAIVTLLLAGLVLTAVLLRKGACRRRMLVALWAIAACNALAWSLFTPALQIPDESAHLSYVQDLAEKKQPPQPLGPSLSPELTIIVDGVGLGRVNFQRDARPPWQAVDDLILASRLATHPSRRNPASYLPVADYPPAYYAGLVPVYRAVTAAHGSTLDAITPMRALSALLAGISVLAVFGFLVELFPERRQVALGVALVCAYQPLLTYISGGVNPDALLIATGTTMFWLFARAFRRGLTWARAVGLGLLLALALLTKVAALGFVPGWVAGMLLLLWQARDRGGRAVLGVGAAAGLAAAVPLVVYGLLNAGPWNRPVLPTGLTGGGGGGEAAPVVAGPHTEVTGFASYLWEYLLPRLNSMTDFFHSRWTPRDLWVPGWVGRFGWNDYGFPNWVNRGALIVYAIIAVAAIIGLVRLLRRRGPEWAPILVAALLGLGLIGAIAKAGYPLRATGNFIFEQGRYYMPLIALFALSIMLALSLVRRRAAQLVTVALVVVSIAHFGGALALTVQRYYTFSGYVEQEHAVAESR